jgi:hypothetical protein
MRVRKSCHVVISRPDKTGAGPHTGVRQVVGCPVVKVIRKA